MTGEGAPAADGDPAPEVLKDWLEPFSSAFTKPTWRQARILVMGALLAPGKRTVTSCLRITGRAMDPAFSSYHQVLNRARWKPHALARCLTRMLVEQLLDKQEPVIIGVDDTIERRWGPCISRRGIYRDAVRSSHGHFVKASGLRWQSFMLLTPLPWLTGIKALPILTLLAPSKRWAEQQGRRHKPITERARQAMCLIVRWLPGRKVIFVGDSSYGTHALARAISELGAILISRMRLDASLYELPEPKTPQQRGRPPQKGKRLPKLNTLLGDPDASWTPITLPVWYGGKKNKALQIRSGVALWYRSGKPTPIRWVLVRDPEGRRGPQALFSTDTKMTAERILTTYIRRWKIEVTLQEVRAHLGVETQRQWSDLAIDRTTPVLFGLYSLVCLWAGDILAKTVGPFQAAWYQKSAFTFSDAIAAVRTRIWLNSIYPHSPPDRERGEIPPPENPDHLVCGIAEQKNLPSLPPGRLKRIIESICYAA